MIANQQKTGFAKKIIQQEVFVRGCNNAITLYKASLEKFYEMMISFSLRVRTRKIYAPTIFHRLCHSFLLLKSFYLIHNNEQ